MKNKLYLLTILIVIGLPLLANSSFSFYGIPESYYGNDTYGVGMGESGYSDIFRVNSSLYNPALVNTANNVVFSTAVSFGNIKYKDKNGLSFKDDAANLPYFNVIVPAKKHRFGFSFNTVGAGNLFNQSVIGTDSLASTEEHTVDANIYKANFVYGFKRADWNFGFGFNYYVGHIYRLWKKDFSSSSYTDSRYEEDKLFKNPGFNFGMTKSLNDDMACSFTYQTAVKLKGDGKFVTNITSIDMPDATYELPHSISFGLTNRFTKTVRVSGDILYELWKSTDTFTDPQNTYKLAVGLAYDPMWGYGRWYEKIPFRVGMNYRVLPFKVNNNTINEISGSFGFSVPLISPDNKLDFAVKYTMRGNSSDNNLQDRSLFFTIGTTGFDIFSKPDNKKGKRDVPVADEIGVD